MKLKINYKAPYEIGFIKKGEWIDLQTIKDENFSNYSLISLGVAMELPAEFEALVVPRSSTFKRYGIMMSNSIGIIDSTYCGNGDVWHFPAFSNIMCSIPAGARIAQFRIQPSQKASVWTKLRWLFTSKIEFNKVDTLANTNRGGFGSTGI